MANDSSSGSSGRLGELLVREKLITPLQLQGAVEQQRKSGGRLGHELTRLGYIDETELTAFLSQQYGVPSINLSDIDIDPEVLKLIPKEVVTRHQVIPVNRSGNTLIVAMADPSNIFAVDDIKFITKFNIEVVVASEQAIADAIEKYYTSNVSFDDVMMDFDAEDEEFEFEDDQEEDINVVDLEKSAGDAPVVKLVNLILLDAIRKNASDIHIEPYEKSMRIRYRIDGVLYEVMKPPIKLKNAIICRFKIMSNLDIAERRLPQDGRIKMKLGRGKEMDFRVSRAAGALGREDRPPTPRQVEPAARHDPTGLRGGRPRQVQGDDRQALRDDPHHGADRIRKDDHAVLGALGAQQEHDEHLHGRGSGRVQPLRHQSGADAR